MKKLYLIVMTLMFCVSVMAQQSIQLRSVDKAECMKSDMTSLKASFSFSTIEAEDYSSDRGTFSWLSLPNTVLGGNVGEPQIPVVNQLIAVPFGATPRIEVTSYSSTDYRLADYDMKTLVPRQPPMRKSQNPDEVPFVMNEAAYQTRGFRSEPMATVSVDGIMRGIQLGTMTIEPVSYDPVNNTIRVFNDIEVTVHFDGADTQATEDMLLKTYSPAFEPVYAQLFNGRAITDVYTDHPDLYNTPVRMLVICYSGFQGNSALNSWLEWKLQKGYYVDIFYTNETGNTASSIKNFIKTKYNASVSAGNAYTYLVVIGDTGQVPQYMTKTIDSSIGECASDLGYSSVNFTTSSTTNYFPDMYYSRMSVENTTHLTNYINKVLTYEKFEFADGGNYLNNVILVGGWDSNWTSRVAKPTINYATNNYFNSSNTTYGGFSGGTIHATISTSSTQGWSGTNHGCYNGLNDGVCFLNYTAHGDKQEWQGPQFTAKQVETLTNTGKYFFGVGNCCLTGNYNLNNANYSSSYAPSSSIGATASFGETMIRVPNAGAIAYVGCSPYSYWYEDFYWAVGAHSFSAGNAPSVSGSTKGVYDVMFADQYWNSASALLYLGNLAVQQAVTNNNTNSGISGSGEGGDCNNSAHYYFQFYHTFGDGSIMPYITKPEANTVTIPSIVTPGANSITVNALAGSYVAVTDNSSVIYGVAEANSSGVATVNFTNAIPGSGTLYVVVTRQQYQPYFGTISVVGGTQYDITATASPSDAGTVEGTGTYYENTQCTLTATANHGYAFVNWNDNNTDNPRTFTVTGDVTYTANFRQLTEHHIIYNAQQTNGTISVSQTEAYAGDIVTLTAIPDDGYILDHWDVNTTNNSNVTVENNQFTMPDSDVTVTAVFSTGYSVTLNQTANGTISADQITALQAGDIVTLTATPDNGCVLLAWYVFKTGDPRAVIAVVDNSYFIMPASDVTVEGIFVTEEEHEAQLGNGTNTNQYIPTYVRANYSLTQQIYLASELGNQKGTITKLAYYGYAQSTQTQAATRNLTIYISHTDKSTFSSGTDWEVMGSTAQAFSGNVTFNKNAWTTITLDTPFEYDGESNINICVVDNTGSTSGSNQRYIQFYRYNGTNRALYANGSSSYANVVGYSNQLESTTGTKINYVNRINITMLVPGSAESLTVSPGAMDDFSYVEGHGPSQTHNIDVVGVDLANDITVTAPTNFEVSTSENGTYAASVTIPRETGSKGSRNVMTWDFENGLQDWTVYDADGDGYNWAHNTSFGGHNGSGIVFSQSYDNSAGALTPDNWLISPQVELGGLFSMWAHPQQAAYPAEHFGIYVSTTDANTSSFTMLNEWTLSTGVWKEFSVDLSAYAGQTGYIAVRHFNCSDQFYINVDDFTLDSEATITVEMPVVITQATVYVRMKDNLNPGTYSGTLTVSAGTGDNLNGSVSLSGEVIAEYDITLTANPSVGGNVTGAGAYAAGTEITVRAVANEGYTFTNWTENGTEVSTNAEYTFVVTADRDLVANFNNVFTLEIDSYNDGGGWHLIASPVAGDITPSDGNGFITDDLGADATAETASYDLYYFDQTGGGENGNGREWKNYRTNNFNLVNGKGYLYASKNGTTLTFTGTPYSGNGQVGLLYSDTYAHESMRGWNLIGNPFGEEAYLTDTTGKNLSFYRMNSDGNAFIAVVTGTINCMEGILVHATSSGQSIKFTTEAPSKGKGNLNINLTQAVANRSTKPANDNAIIRFDNGNTLEKFSFREGSSKVYIPQDGKDYSVVNAENQGEMPINFRAEENGTYTLSFSNEEVTFSYLHLIDNKTGNDIDLLQTPNYTFNATTTDYESRFKLVFAVGSSAGSEIFAFCSNGNWIISNEGQATLQVIDVTGRILSSETVNGSVSKAIHAAPGIYMLRLINGDNVKVQKIEVR